MYMKNGTENKLFATPVFANIPEEKLVEISQIVQNKVVPAHTIIFQQGDIGDSFYIINSGRVRVYRKSKEGVETDLVQLGPGESFGELALITGKPRMGYVESLEKTDLTVIPGDQFNKILRDYPHVSSTLIKQMSSWLDQGDYKLEIETKRQQLPDISWIDFLIIFGVSLFFSIVFNLSNPHGIKLIHKSLSAEPVLTVMPSVAIEKYHEGKTLFIDVMPSNFFKQEHIKGAMNLPLALFEIMYMMELSDVDKEKEIIVYGRTISRLYDEDVARKLILRGHRNTRILKGGLSQWKKKGYPVET
jgi:rhodanese-related sulfurtransferase